MIKAMQATASVGTRIKKTIAPINGYRYYQIWQESPRKLRSRTNLHANRYSRPVLPIRDCGDTVARSVESVGERENIHFVSTSYGRVYFDGDAEDQDIDDPQSKRWRGG